jgi:hypothetical protein
MKNIPTFKKTALTLSLAITTAWSAFAQYPGVVYPSTPDNYLGSDGYPNSATIDYSPFCAGPCGSFANPQLTAVVADGPSPTLYIDDQVTTKSISISGSSPDVIVGNDISSPGKYIVAVISNVSSGPSSNDAFLYLYQVTGVGTGSLSASLVSTIPLSHSGSVVGAPHIDIVSEYSTSFYSLPRCDKFIATWQDASGIYGSCASLSAPASGYPFSLGASLTATSPDVAAVERQNASGGFETWGLFSFIDGNTINCQEVEFLPSVTTGLPSTFTLPSATSFVSISTFFSTISTARIDAIDDYSQNLVSGPNAYYNMVATTTSGGANNVQVYNNFTWPSSVDITTPIINMTSAKNIVPVVTSGPGNFYSVGYYGQPVGAPTSYYVTAVDWSWGYPYSDPNVYQIPLISGGSGPGIALSATCNTNTLGQQQLFATWQNSQLYYKYTANIAPYAFKHQSSSQSTLNNIQEWTLYPNPADEMATLLAPTNQSTSEGYSYRFMDMTGRILLDSKIAGATQQIDISKFASGMYLLNVRDANSIVKSIKITKN